jgi:hypothetical protein
MTKTSLWRFTFLGDGWGSGEAPEREKEKRAKTEKGFNSSNRSKVLFLRVSICHLLPCSNLSRMTSVINRFFRINPNFIPNLATALKGHIYYFGSDTSS